MACFLYAHLHVIVYGAIQNSEMSQFANQIKHSVIKNLNCLKYETNVTDMQEYDLLLFMQRVCNTGFHINYGKIIFTRHFSSFLESLTFIFLKRVKKFAVGVRLLHQLPIQIRLFSKLHIYYNYLVLVHQSFFLSCLKMLIFITTTKFLKQDGTSLHEI